MASICARKLISMQPNNNSGNSNKNSKGNSNNEIPKSDVNFLCAHVDCRNSRADQFVDVWHVEGPCEKKYKRNKLNGVVAIVAIVIAECDVVVCLVF